MEPGDLWAVVWHVKGALHVMRVKELLEVNVLRRERNEPGYMPLAIVGSMEVAAERKRELGRVELREKHNLERLRRA